MSERLSGENARNLLWLFPIGGAVALAVFGVRQFVDHANSVAIPVQPTTSITNGTEMTQTGTTSSLEAKGEIILPNGQILKLTGAYIVSNDGTKYPKVEKVFDNAGVCALVDEFGSSGRSQWELVQTLTFGEGYGYTNFTTIDVRSGTTTSFDASQSSSSVEANHGAKITCGNLQN